jgi:hypothetical protein
MSDYGDDTEATFPAPAADPHDQQGGQLTRSLRTNEGTRQNV